MKGEKIVILDRDGVINQYPGHGEYVKNLSQFKWVSGAIEGIKMLKKAGFTLAVASNQAGISKGLYSQQDLDEITEKIKAELDKSGILIDEFNYCIHTDKDNCDCRKPKPGLLKKAAGECNPHAYFIGDTYRDVETAKNYGCRAILVLTGKEKDARVLESWPLKPDFVANDLPEAAKIIIKNEKLP